MKSEIRVFKERDISPRGKVLPISEFKLFRDAEGDKINDELGAFFVGEAEKMLDEEIPLLPLSLYRDFKLTTVRSRFERPHHRRRTILFHMTMAEAYERKGRFVEKLADVLWAILEETCWVIPAHYIHSTLDPKTEIPEVYKEEQMPGLDLYVAATAGTVALTRHLLKNELDAISPVICKRIDHLVNLRAVRPFASVPFGWSGAFGNNPNNWVTHITATVLFATAICTEDISMRERVVERAMSYLDNFTAGYPEDGWCDEGPGYFGGAGGKYFDALELIDDMTGGAIQVYDHPLIKNMGEYIAAVNIDARYFLNFADAHPKLDQDGKMLMRFGKKCGSPELYSFGMMAEANADITKGYAFGSCYRVYRESLTPEIHEADKVLAKKSVWYSGDKVAIFRESEYTSEGFFLATKGGCNLESHNHNDVGCLVVYANGKPVIIDPSHGSYDNGFFGPTRYGRWYMKSGYHSVPTVDGIHERQGKQYASRDEVCDLENQTVSMELAGAFTEDVGILSMRRTCSLKNSTITVKDEVKLDHEGDIQFNYLTLDEPKVLADGRLEISEGRIFEYDPAGLEYVAEKVENTWLPYEDLNFKKLWDRECLWLITLRAKATEKTVEVTIR